MSAAYFLQQRGYRDVVVLERENRVGGMCRTVEYEGRHIEAGAMIVTDAFPLVRSLASAVGADQYYPMKSGVAYEADTFKQEHWPQALSHDYGRGQYARALLAYLRLRRSYGMGRPGLRGVPSEIARSFSDWSSAPKFQPLQAFFERGVLGMGYGPYDTLPTAYVFKMFSWANIWSFMRTTISGESGRAPRLRPGMLAFVRGYQTVWDEMSKRMDVRLNANITRIERNGNIAVHLQGVTEPLRFDRLIVTSPLDRSLDFLDASNDERDLFSRIQYSDYHVFITRAAGLPDRPVGAFHAARNGSVGRMSMGVTNPPSDLRVLYLRGEIGENRRTLPPDQVLESALAQVERLGGKVSEVVEQIHWPYYFPHVSPEAMLAGYYDRLEALQGDRDTFYANGLMNFGDVEHTVEYSRDLVDRHF